ncbi:hypothetical protein FGG78_23435 [Thioclava sp. BHET1]|nr:hypothetical protein FGG78_23435 [Thioclava sp. BHET1]
MRGGLDRWLSGRIWDDEPAPRRARLPEDDRHVTYAAGQAFRDERSIAVPKFTMTQDEQRVLAQRAREAALERKAAADRRLTAAVRLGAALRALEG